MGVVDVTLTVKELPDLVTPSVYSVPLKLRIIAPAVVGFCDKVIWVALSTLSTIVPGKNSPSPDTFSISIPAKMPVVEETVITLDDVANVVETFSTLLGACIPSLNWDNAKVWLEFEASLKSNAYVLPTYKVKFGVISNPLPVSIKNLKPVSMVLIVNCGLVVPCFTTTFVADKAFPITVIVSILLPETVLDIISELVTKVPSS